MIFSFLDDWCKVLLTTLFWRPFTGEHENKFFLYYKYCVDICCTLDYAIFYEECAVINNHIAVLGNLFENLLFLICHDCTRHT